MSTGGPDPNREDESDLEVARGDMGDPGSTRFGLSSGWILLIVLVIAALMIWLALPG